MIMSPLHQIIRHLDGPVHVLSLADIIQDLFLHPDKYGLEPKVSGLPADLLNLCPEKRIVRSSLIGSAKE